MDTNTIIIDPSNHNSLVSLMDRFADPDEIIVGKNENGETVISMILSDRIITHTAQHNGWVRKNIYWRDGPREESYNK